LVNQCLELVNISESLLLSKIGSKKMEHFNTTKKLLRYGIACMLSVLGFAHAQAQGGGRAINFPGSAANEHINLGDSLSNKLDTVSFTLEMWVNLNVTSGDPVFIGNKDWNSGGNTGFEWNMRNNQPTQVQFNFKPAGGTRVDYYMTIPKLQGNWNHIAMVVDRKGMLTGYVNGVQAGTPVNIAVDSLKTLDGALPIRIGQDGTGTYSSKFAGKIDEVRIWKSVRTQAQLRDNMCHKLAGTETGLLAYYPMNETTGTAIVNNAAAYATVFNGTMMNSPLRVNSGAAIGDTAVNVYPATFTGVVLSLASAAHGNTTIQNMAGSLKGMQLYRVDAAPNTYGAIPNPNANNVYFGVFPVDTATSGSYAVLHDYTNFPAANTFEGGIDLYRRKGSDSAWNATAATKNTTANTLALNAQSGLYELIIGNFSNPAICNTPSGLAAQNIAATSATLSWVSGGSNRWNIEYGAGNFTIGTGTRISNLNATTYNTTGLTPNTTYKFYVQDTCAGLNNSSAWAGPFTFTTQADYSKYGAGYAMSFPGTASNEHVNLGTAVSAELDTNNFSIELWVNFDKFNDDEVIIGNKNWNNGANVGWSLGRSDKSGFPANTLWFNVQPLNGIRRDWHITLPGLNLIHNWNHVAVTVDRKGSIAFYINGIPATIAGYAQGGTNSWTTVTMDISADSNKYTKGTLPFRLGQDGTGTYGVKFKGMIDEVRIWKTVRTQAEIRNNMCRKVAPSNTDLLAYYRMDEASGNIAANLAASTAGSFNGTLTNNPVRVVSGAAIGDTSAYVYANSLAGNSLELASAQNGKVIVDSLGGTYSALQIYRVDTIPNTTYDIANLGNNKTYFGVFVYDTAGVNTTNTVQVASDYRLRYDYSNYPTAVTNAANLHLYNRSAGDVMMWTDFGANNNTTTHQLVIDGIQKRKEVILADFNVQSCANVTNVHTDSLMSHYARIAWTSNGSKWNVQYGLQGFVLGTGTIDTVTTVKDGLTNLNADQTYDVYVRNHCSNTDSGKWVGPYSFHTPDPCAAPTGLEVHYLGGDSVIIMWPNNGSSSYVLEWAQQGYTLGAGILIEGIDSSKYILTGLSNNMSFDVYLRDSCDNIGQSKWYGPVTFQANGPIWNPNPPTPTAVSNTAVKGTEFNVYPNPAQQYIVIEPLVKNEISTVELYNVQGVLVRKESVRDRYQMNIGDLADGLYMLKCSNHTTRQTFKMIVRK